MAVDFDKAAYYYDAMYGNEEEYRTEAEHIRKLAQKYGAGKRLIDIACGTGLAAKYLLRDFCVTGVDLSERMLDKARKNAPGARFLRGDMFSFSLREKFDIAVNLYGSAGFAKDTDALAAMCACAYKCLAGGGLFILTPWSTRETFAESITADSGRRGGLAFCRMEAVRRKDAPARGDRDDPSDRRKRNARYGPLCTGNINLFRTGIPRCSRRGGLLYLGASCRSGIPNGGFRMPKTVGACSGCFPCGRQNLQKIIFPIEYFVI